MISPRRNADWQSLSNKGKKFSKNFIELAKELGKYNINLHVAKSIHKRINFCHLFILKFTNVNSAYQATNKSIAVHEFIHSPNLAPWRDTNPQSSVPYAELPTYLQKNNFCRCGFNQMRQLTACG
jgi:hypothetical protein